MPCSQVGSSWSCFGLGKMVHPMGYMGSAWCIAYTERHYEVCNASLQPLPVNANEERQEIGLL